MVTVHPDVLFDVETYFNYLFFITGHLEGRILSAETLPDIPEIHDTVYSVTVNSKQAMQAVTPHASWLFYRDDGSRSSMTSNNWLHSINKSDHPYIGVNRVSMAHFGRPMSIMGVFLAENGPRRILSSSNFLRAVREESWVLKHINMNYQEHFDRTILKITDPTKKQEVAEKLKRFMQLEIGRLLGQ